MTPDKSLAFAPSCDNESNASQIHKLRASGSWKKKAEKGKMSNVIPSLVGIYFFIK